MLTCGQLAADFPAAVFVPGLGVQELSRNDPEVDAVLESAGLGQLSGRFAAEDIDRSVLWSLRDSDLRELGLTIGQRRKLLERLKSGTSPSGSSAEPLAMEPELRRLTVLFSDLVGYTELVTRIDPDELRPLLQKYYAAARAAAGVFGGFIASLQGDGVVMLFGFPATQGASADRAIGAAHAMMTGVSAISHRLTDGRTIGIAARIGVASGRAIVGYPAGATGGEPEMVGPVINRAARLQAIAEPGMVVVDEPTRSLASTTGAFLPLPDAELKGFGQKVPVWQAVVTAMAASALPRVASGGPVSSVHLSESRALAAAWRTARERQPVLALLTGEAGIGKSTLAAQFTAQAADAGARVLHLACMALSAQVPLRPVIDMLEAMLGATSDAAPGVRLDMLRHLFASAPAEELGAVSSLLGLAGTAAGSMMAPKADRRLLLGALSRFLAGDGTCPCLIAIEDIHWADPTTRDLLLCFAETLPERGVMMLATSRNAHDPVWSGDGRRLHIPLAPLGQEAAESVLSHHLAGRELPEKIVQTIVAKSDGNPLMLEALARSLEGWKDAEPGHDFQVPASIYESLSGRMETLLVGRRAAAALSVFDEPTDEATLALALGIGMGELDEAVAELVDAGIAERAGSGLQRSVRFRHNLYREVCYERLVKSVRESLHRDAYAALARMNDDIATRRPGHMAWHAFEGGDHATAAPLALAAGEQALQRSALIEAGHFLRQALASLDRLNRTRQTDQLRLRVLIAQSSVSRARLGIASDEVGLLGRQVLDLARSLGETRSEMIALNGLYTHALVRADYVQAGNWAARLSEEAQLSQDQTFRMIGTRGLGVVALHTGVLDQAAAALQQALDSYDEALHLPLAHVHGYDHAEICAAFLSFTLWLKGDPAGATKASAFSVSHSRRIDHKHSLGQAQMFRAMLTALANDGAAVLASAREAGELGRKHDLAVMRGASGFFVEAGQLMSRPEPPTAAELQSLRQRYQEFTQVNPYNYHPIAGMVMARLHLAGNAIAEADHVLRHAEAVQDRTREVFVRPELMRVRSNVLAAQGNTVAAGECLQAALQDAGEMGASMLELRIACDIAGSQPSPAALARVQSIRLRLVSEDGGWDFARCQALLGSPVKV
jgi:class 3 adenylate cyclase